MAGARCTDEQRDWAAPQLVQSAAVPGRPRRRKTDSGRDASARRVWQARVQPPLGKIVHLASFDDCEPAARMAHRAVPTRRTRDGRRDWCESGQGLRGGSRRVARRGTGARRCDA